jgi:hypothetical protein
MAVLESSIGVQEPAAPDISKRIDNVQVVTGEGAVQRQGIVPSDPEDPAARQKITAARPGVSAYGAVVRQVPANYDSGLLEVDSVAGTPVAITGSTTDLDVLLLANVGASFVALDLTDGNGLGYMNAFPVGPNSLQAIPLYGIRFAAGVKAHASAAGLKIQLRGHQ